jgi:hypothetical protein
VTGSARRTVKCAAGGAHAAARLTRRGHTYARGTTSRLRAAARLPRGRYTLRTGRAAIAVPLA